MFILEFSYFGLLYTSIITEKEFPAQFHLVGIRPMYRLIFERLNSLLDAI